MKKVARFMSALICAAIVTPAGAASPATADVCGVMTPADGMQLPSTAAVVQSAVDWADKINSADDAVFVRFMEERGPIQRGGVERWLESRDILRGIRLCGVKSAEANGVELLAFIPNLDAYGILRFKPGATEADRPEYQGGAGTDAVPPGAAPPARLALPELIEAISVRAANAAAKDQFSGAVLLAKGGRVLFQKAYGLADRARRTPNKLNTQFRFGSMGKMFTAVAIMQLVERGRVDLEAPIGRYLTDLPNRDIATKVTVANLLSHTGGTGDIFGPEYDRRKTSLRSMKDYVELYGSRAPEFAPGARQSYSNYGFILLGRIVEQVSGLAFDDYLQRNIFSPVGMTSTGNRPNSEILPGRAVGYRGSGARLKSADDWLPPNGTAAGGGYASAGDFNRFIIGLTSRQLLRRETLQKLIDGGVKMDDGQFAGFDFGGTDGAAGRFIGHGGGAPGMNGSLQHFLMSGITVIVLANRDFPAAESIAAYAAHRMPIR